MTQQLDRREQIRLGIIQALITSGQLKIGATVTCGHWLDSLTHEILTPAVYGVRTVREEHGRERHEYFTKEEGGKSPV